jgi:hypothetical protein
MTPELVRRYNAKYGKAGTAPAKKTETKKAAPAAAPAAK